MGLCHLWTALRSVRKLQGTVDWSWKRVTAPLWVPYCILAVITAGMLTIARIKNGKW